MIRVIKFINIHPSFHLASKHLYPKKTEALPALPLPLMAAYSPTQAPTDWHHWQKNHSARAGPQ